jgi:alcohol dehydrogenase (cytochrome c)
MNIKKLAFVTSAAVILIGTICAGALYWHPIHWKSLVGLESVSNEKIWESFSWRSRLYLKKARGGVPEISWTELWELTRPGSGFNWSEGRSIESALHFSSIASESDREAGARIFHERCTGCHGSDGSGGLHGPSLVRSGYKHGDSDLAIYKHLRDGIPGTAMPSAGLPLKERLQVIAAVRLLQLHSSEHHEAGASRLAIQVSSERLQAAGTNPDEWLTYSGSYNGWRHTSLAEITSANVAQLKLRWTKQFDINDSFIEATPLVVDGVIFMAADPSKVLALDAKTGDVLWEYGRPIPDDLLLCCGRGSRGLGVHGSTLFLGSIDGYLVAINANDGKVIWQTLVASPSDGYSITGAPLVVNDSVVVGIGGGEFGIRGFLAAYDVSTGKQQWKFQTIPGPGEVGHETWENDAWRTGGGGGTWNTGSYDPSTDLLYWGVGNPSPDYSGDVRPGDNLFTESVIALHASTGQLAWHFQFTPHDEHDWDSAQTPVLADLSISGVIRKVICWPNRNGFYYVLDRVTGGFLVGVPFVEQDWAEGFTPAGRPILSDANARVAGRLTKPGVEGGTSWQNPAFDQKRGSIFVPATESSAVFTKLPPNEIIRPQHGDFLGSGGITTTDPPTRLVRALDAATGRRKWEYFSSPARRFSGLLATAGGLVFWASGRVFFALDADSGRELWRVPLGGETIAAPISFTLDGRQVIAVAAGRALFVFGL